MILPVIALAFLTLAIILGFVKNINTGVTAMALALIAAIICGIGNKELIAGFPTNTFVLLFGVMFYFEIVQSNKTLHVLAQKIMVLTGKNVKILPFVVLYLSAFISGVGVGPVPTISVMTLASVSLALEMGLSPFIFMLMSAIGGVIGSCSPFSLVGLISISLMEPMGCFGTEWPFFINTIIGHSICAMVLCILLKFYHMKPTKIVGKSQIEKFNKEQLVTLISMALFILMVAVFKLHVGLSGLIVAFALILLGYGNDRTAIKNMPWSTLMMITGVNLLMNIVVLTGGIDLLTQMLTTLMRPLSALPVITFSAGFMSIFSTTSSVVVPTFLPTIPGIIDMFSNVTAAQMVSSIVNGSYSASISPLSAGGGTALAAFVTLAKISSDEQAIYFKKLMLFAIINLVVMSLVSFLGNWIYIR